MDYFFRSILILFVNIYFRGGDALEVRNISVCYGNTHNNFKSINCETSEVILVRSVRAMAKPSSAQCPQTETVFEPAEENCCRYEENDCGGEYTGDAFKAYFNTCHGKQQCPQLQASWEPTSEKFSHCNGSIYPEKTNYMIFEYSCVPLSYTNSPCSSTAVMGESVFLWNEGYPNPMLPSNTCNCSIEALCDSQIAVTAIDLRLTTTQDGCQQHFIISDDTSMTSVNCNHNNDFRPISVFTSNSYFATITFTNNMQTNIGLFWIEISGLESAEFSLRCGSELHTSISSQEKETCGVSSTTIGSSSTAPSGSNYTDDGGNSTLGNDNTTTDNGNDNDQGNNTLDNTNGVNNDTNSGNGTIDDGTAGNGTDVDGSGNGANNNDTNGSENGNGNSTNVDDTNNGSNNNGNVNGTTDSTGNNTTTGDSDSTETNTDNGTDTNGNSGNNSGNGSDSGNGNNNGNGTNTNGDNNGLTNGSMGNNSNSDGSGNSSDSGNMQHNETSTGDQDGDDDITDATGGTSPNTEESGSSGSSIAPIIAIIAVVAILLIVGGILVWKRRPIKEKLCPSQVNEKQDLDDEALYDEKTNPLFNSGAFVLIPSVAAKNTAYPEKHGHMPLIEPTNLDKTVPNGRLSPIVVPKVPPSHLPPIKGSGVAVFTQKALPRLGLMSLILDEHEANPLPSIGQSQNGSVIQGGDVIHHIDANEEKQKKKSSKKKKNKLLKKLKQRNKEL